MDEYDSPNHTKSAYEYHVVFILKRRRGTLYVQLRQYLGEIFRRLAEQKERRIEEAFDVRPCSHDDSHLAEIRGFASGWLHQGQERDPSGSGDARYDANGTLKAPPSTTTAASSNTVLEWACYEADSGPITPAWPVRPGTIILPGIELRPTNLLHDFPRTGGQISNRRAPYQTLRTWRPMLQSAGRRKPSLSPRPSASSVLAGARDLSL